MCADLLKLGDQVEILEEYVDGWHIDIMDGKFVPNITLGFDLINQLRLHSKLPIEVHLMVNEPLRYIERLKDVDRIFIHAEALESKPFIENQDIGLVINENTNTENLPAWAFEFNHYLIMGVPAGFSGQKFSYTTIRKIEKLMERANKVASICVDGGVKSDTIPIISQIGATSIAVGTGIFQHKDIVNAVLELRESVMV